MRRALGLCLALLLLAGPVAAQGISLVDPGDKARSEISVVVKPGLTSTRKLPTKELRLARLALIDKQPVAEPLLKALADKGDGLAALKYVRKLVGRLPAASDSDIAHYATLAVATGRVWPLRDAVEAMRRLDPETEPSERKKAYLAMLYPHAWAGNVLAIEALIDLNGEGKLFGPMSDQTRKRLLDMAEESKDARIPLRMAIAMLREPKPDLERVRDYLGRALKSDHPGVQATAANLLANLAAPGGDAVPSQ